MHCNSIITFISHIQRNPPKQCTVYAYRIFICMNACMYDCTECTLSCSFGATHEFAFCVVQWVHTYMSQKQKRRVMGLVRHILSPRVILRENKRQSIKYYNFLHSRLPRNKRHCMHCQLSFTCVF